MSTKPKHDTPMGQEIRRLREQRGWSLGELAKRGGTTKSYVFGIENGQSVPTIGKFWKLAHALGVSMEGLFTGHGDLGQVGTGDRVGAILAEREWQRGAKRNLSPERWATILAEECGEVARAGLDHDMAAMRAEAVHVAAVALAIVEWVDNDGRKRDPQEGGSESVPPPCWGTAELPGRMSLYGSESVPCWETSELPSRASLCGSDPNFTGDILDAEAQQ